MQNLSLNNTGCPTGESPGIFSQRSLSLVRREHPFFIYPKIYYYVRTRKEESTNLPG